MAVHVVYCMSTSMAGNSCRCISLPHVCIHFWPDQWKDRLHMYQFPACLQPFLTWLVEENSCTCTSLWHIYVHLWPDWWKGIAVHVSVNGMSASISDLTDGREWLYMYQFTTCLHPFLAWPMAGNGCASTSLLHVYIHFWPDWWQGMAVHVPVYYMSTSISDPIGGRKWLYMYQFTTCLHPFLIRLMAGNGCTCTSLLHCIHPFLTRLMGGNGCTCTSLLHVYIHFWPDRWEGMAVRVPVYYMLTFICHIFLPEMTPCGWQDVKVQLLSPPSEISSLVDIAVKGGERMSDWLILSTDRLSEWVSEWLSGWFYRQTDRVSVWVSEWLADFIDRVSECVSEWVGGWFYRQTDRVSEWLSEWVSGWFNRQTVRVSECVSEWVTGWFYRQTHRQSEFVSEWVSEWLILSTDRQSEWVCEWVSEWVIGWFYRQTHRQSEWVSEWLI